jgi:hypothetical protein
MAATSQVATVSTGRSLLDDVSTINNASDAEETLATEDTFALRHESDNMFPERQSEHSRLLTDDDQSFNTWSTKRLGYGGSSVNTGSTYEETPFLTRVAGSSQPLQKVPEQQPINQTFEHQVEDEQEGITDTVKLVQSDDSRANGSDGYACEMIFETQAMLQKAKDKVGTCFMGLFHKDTKRGRSGSSSLVISTVNGVLGAAGDKIDRVLIKLFDVPNPDFDANPKYAVSVNESLTNDYRYVLEAAVKSTSYPKRSRHNRSKKETKPDTSVSSSSRSSSNAPNPETFLVPIYSDSQSECGASEEKVVEEEHSDIRDDLDEVLSDNYVPSIEQTGTHDSVAQFKESLYGELMDKRESTSTASSIDSDAMREKSLVGQRKSGSDTESVARVLDRYMQGSSLARRSTNKNQSEFGDLADKEASDDQVSFSELHQSHVKELIQKNQVIQSIPQTESAVVHMAYDDDEISFSALHRRHVVDLINKNITATNRSSFVDLSSVDPLMDDNDETVLSLNARPRDTKTTSPAASNAGREWNSSTLEVSAEVEATESIERSWHGSSFAEVDEIDTKLNMRREKLRKMMNELNKSLGKAEKAMIMEQREGDVDEHRDGQSEDRAILVPEIYDAEVSLGAAKPIDLTLYDECF